MQFYITKAEQAVKNDTDSDDNDFIFQIVLYR